MTKGHKKSTESPLGYETLDAFVQNEAVNNIREQISFHTCHNDIAHCLVALCRDSAHSPQPSENLLLGNNKNSGFLKDNYLEECTRNTR